MLLCKLSADFGNANKSANTLTYLARSFHPFSLNQAAVRPRSFISTRKNDTADGLAGRGTPEGLQHFAVLCSLCVLFFRHTSLHRRTCACYHSRFVLSYLLQRTQHSENLSRTGKAENLPRTPLFSFCFVLLWTLRPTPFADSFCTTSGLSCEKLSCS